MSGLEPVETPWERAQRGLHTVVFGPAPAAPPPGLRVVRVHCDGPATTLGPLLEARGRVERILGSSAPLMEMARTRVVSGLRRHLLGDAVGGTSDGSLVDVLNRFAELGPSALVLEAADAADAATVDMLRHILARPSWLRLPLVLVLRAAPTSAAMRALVDAVRAASGDAAVPEAEPDVAPRATEARAPERPPLAALPADVLRVLRALALVGSGSDAALVAEVVGVRELEALEALQGASDAGFPLEDRGEGRIYLADEDVASLRASMLPSLTAALHRRIAAVVAREGAAPPRRELPEAPTVEPSARPADAWDVMPPAPPPPSIAEPSIEAPAAGGSEGPPAPYKPFSGEPPPRERDAPRASTDARAAELFTPATAMNAGSSDEARAARHLEEAGDAEAAIERYFRAAVSAAAAAAYPLAIAHVQSALSLLDRLPPTEKRRLQRGELLLHAARVHWHAGGPDESFTLQGALRVAESARAALREGDPPDLVVEIASTAAGILCDIGDADSLSQALDVLATASRALAIAGAPREGARLFNDQASVLLRAGDPVRAAHLLTESKKLFEPSSSEDLVSMAEMAETDHSFARLLLQATARPGREDDALSLGLDHGLAAERAFERLGAVREASRVLDTMGRLELKRGRLERAARHVTKAARMQERIGDIIGLASSTAALSEALIAGGQLPAGLGLLADSIELNGEKGSRLGLAYNRRALERLLADEKARSSQAPALEALRGRVNELDAALGRAEIPGSADAG